MYSAMFFLPMALVFAITGILLICGVKDNVGAQTSEIITKIQEGEDLKTAVFHALQEHNLDIPKNAEIRENRNMKMMGGAAYSILIKEQGDKLSITAIKRSLIGQAILLHKAKVGLVFNVFAVVFGVILLFSYISGIVIMVAKHRKSATITFLLGLLACLVLAAFSV